MSETKSAIVLENLKKSYGDLPVLKDISLDIRSGERLVILGPSGSGKSTLIRCINLLERPEGGRILVHGVDIMASAENFESVRRNIGMVFQQFNLFPHMTILENCTLAPRLVKKMGQAEAAALAMDYLEKVFIADQADKYPSRLSGGQQQRAAIARALCMNPSIMLFDEPTSSLDPEMTREVLDVMAALAQDGMTMVCVTHEMEFARQIADRIVFVDAGEILEIQQPEAFFQEPKHERARSFLEKILRYEPAYTKH